ncbi:MAG: hypothetical protein HZC28_10760 [Spirochaetes bacterium]|nr:hypothetical protein [Spirochaetota bacterium]
MKKKLAVAYGFIAGISLLLAAPLKTWDMNGLNDIRLSPAKGNDVTMNIAPEKTPDGKSVLAVHLQKLRSTTTPWDVQLRLLFTGTLRAGKTYDIVFTCRASVTGDIMLVPDQTGTWKMFGSMTGRSVTTEWQTMKLSFTPDDDSTGTFGIPRFMLAKFGTEPATLYFGPASLSEAEQMLSYSLSEDWLAFVDVPQPDDYSSMPDTSPGSQTGRQAQTIRLMGGAIDLAQRFGPVREKKCAVFYQQFTAPFSGKMRIGVAADWWLEVYMNGDKVFGTVPRGNETHDFTVNDHIIDVPVRSGTNLIAIKVLSGSAGWKFICGKPTRAPGDSGIFIVKPGAAWKAVNMNNLMVQPGTALDFSRMANIPETVEGRGRVIVNTAGRLAFERHPDRQVRFHAHNTWLQYWDGSLYTRSKDELEEFAAATARQGYTMVRFQAGNRFLLGMKQFQNAPDFTAFMVNSDANPIAFDAAAIDTFDYLLACLKKHSIYLNLDIMSYADGFITPRPKKIRSDLTFKVQLLYDTNYRRHWAAGAAYLLNHKNPYTGTALKDDPIIALLEPYNEQDILLFDTNAMRVHSLHFHQYIRNRYTTDEALRTAWGDTTASRDVLPEISEELLRKGDARSRDAGTFLIQAMQETTDWYVATLREIGYGGLISQWDMIIRTMEIPVRAKMPVIAQHTYFAHPQNVPSKQLAAKSSNWNKICGDTNIDISTHQDSSLHAAYSPYVRSVAAARFLDRPFLITEHSHAAFNRYRHERGLFFGSYAALQGWDSLTTHGTVTATPRTTSLPFITFDNAVDPISRASDIVERLTWGRGDVATAPHTVAISVSDSDLFPKNYLAAIGDDYAQLSMLTKIGIVYPDVQPLIPVGTAHAELTVTPASFSPLRVSAMFISASSSDEKIFPSLLEQLRQAGIITAGNRTDPEARIYQSETGEITLDGKAGKLMVITPRLVGALVKKNEQINLGSVRIEGCTAPASITVASIDQDKPIAAAKRQLLIFATDALNTGMTFDSTSRMLCAEIGTLPVLMETARLSLRMKTEHVAAPVIYALNMDGSRAERVSGDFTNGILSLTLDTARLIHATPFFEIVFP